MELIILGTILGLLAVSVFSFLIGKITFGALLLTIFFVIGLMSVKKIPNNPPHKGVVVILGKRKNIYKKKYIYKNEGWHFLFPLFDIYNIIPVDVTKKNKDFPPETVRTPDLAVLQIPISLTWIPDKNHLVEYLDSGGENGVWEIIQDVVKERVRAWAINNQEGPQDFEEALGAREEAVEVLIKAVSGKELKTIDSVVPTPILFKYFNNPPESPTKSQARMWGKNWEKVKQVLQGEDVAKIKEEVDKRKEAVKEIQRGNGSQPLPNLGIVLKRLNIGDIEIKKGTDLERASEQSAKEKKEAEAEKVEISNLKKRIKELIRLGLSPQEARDFLQTERGKVQKNIHDIQGFQGLDINKIIETILKGRS